MALSPDFTPNTPPPAQSRIPAPLSAPSPFPLGCRAHMPQVTQVGLGPAPTTDWAEPGSHPAANPRTRSLSTLARASRRLGCKKIMQQDSEVHKCHLLLQVCVAHGAVAWELGPAKSTDLQIQE